jgi:molecular chaperone GrpE
MMAMDDTRIDEERVPPPGEPAGEEFIPEAAASTVDEEAVDVDSPLDALRAELEAVNDRYLRLAAEFDNYRKRTDRERAEARTRAQADLVAQLLEVLDDLQRVAGFAAESTNVESLLQGVGLVEKKFRHILESQGLEAISAEGEVFNPTIMEALMTVPVDRPEEDDMVADVFQKGYRFREVLIRPARVRVKKYEA